MAAAAKAMAGLPIEQLICGPLIAVARGQAALCEVYLEYLFKMAWKDGKQDGETNMIRFNLERPVTDGAGNIAKKSFNVEAPLLSLVPVPAFIMEEATVEFTMEIQDKTSSESEQGGENEYKLGGSYFGIGGSISGKSTSSSKNTRSSDQSSKYNITAKARQQPPSEGMAKLTQIFASVIDPIDVGSGG